MISYCSLLSFVFFSKCIPIIQHYMVFLNSINKFTLRHLFLLKDKAFNFILFNYIFYIYFFLFVINPVGLLLVLFPRPLSIDRFMISVLAPARIFSLHESQFSTLHSAPKEKKDEKFHAAATSLPSLRY